MYKQLYKYTEKRWALGMIEKGEFLIGTLHNFQNIERYGTEIGDEGEGTKSRYSSDTVNTDQPGPALDFLRENVFAKRVPKHWVFKDINFVASGSSKNCYLYSLTHDLNADSMEKLDKNYDTAIRIVHPELFLVALTEALHEKIPNNRYLNYKLGECVYIERHQHYSNTVPPMLIKPARFSYQKEVRMVWQFLGAEIEPIKIQSSTASAFCSIVSNEALQRSRTAMNPQNL